MGKTMKVTLLTSMGSIPMTIGREDTGKQVFDKAVLSIGIKEFWYFSLETLTSDGNSKTWISMTGRLLEQAILLGEPLTLFLKCRYYPDDIDNLSHELTRRLIFCQMLNEINTGATLCPPEVAMMMSSYAAQAMFGDFNPKIYKSPQLANKSILCHGLMNDFSMKPRDAERLALRFYENRRGSSRAHATYLYLRMAADLDLYGSAQATVTTPNGQDVLIMFDPSGIKFFSASSRLTPKVAFHWGELKSVNIREFEVTLTFCEDTNPEITLQTAGVSFSRWLFTEILAYQKLYQRSQQSESELLQEIRHEGQAQQVQRPSGCATLSAVQAKAEEADFRKHAANSLALYEGKYSEIREKMALSGSEWKGLNRRLEELKRQLQIAQTNYNKTVQTKRFYDLETSLCTHHIPTLARHHNSLTDKALRERDHLNIFKQQVEICNKLSDDAKARDDQLQEKLSKMATPAELWLCDMDLDHLSDLSDISQEFVMSPEERQPPWQRRNTLILEDSIMKDEFMAIIEEMSQSRSEVTSNALYAEFMENALNGRTKYTVFRQLLEMPLATRLQLLENWDSRM